MCIRDRSYYGLGDPLDLLAAFVPGRWTEQLLEGLIVLRLYLAAVSYTHLDVYKRQR